VKEWEASYGLFLEELLSGFHRSNKEGKKWVFLPGGPEMASLAKESFVNLANPSESRLPTIIHLLPGDMDWMDNWVIQRDQLLRSLSGEGEPLEILKRRIQYHKKITEWYLPKADFTIVLKSKDRDCFLPKIEEILTALRGVASGATPP
jgi:hypothetical protein